MYLISMTQQKPPAALAALQTDSGWLWLPFESIANLYCLFWKATLNLAPDKQKWQSICTAVTFTHHVAVYLSYQLICAVCIDEYKYASLFSTTRTRWIYFCSMKTFQQRGWRFSLLWMDKKHWQSFPEIHWTQKPCEALNESKRWGNRSSLTINIFIHSN